MTVTDALSSEREGDDSTADADVPTEQSMSNKSVAEGPRRPPIEIGLVVGERLDAVDRPALARATNRVIAILRQRFPDFDWQVVTLHRPELITTSLVEPSDLLQNVAEDRDARRWDFAILVTSADLASHYEPFCHAAVSRPLDAAVISTSLIDPLATGNGGDPDKRIATVECRLAHLFLKTLLHLAGVASKFPVAEACESDPDSLDDALVLDPEQERTLISNLHEVADQRLEEGNDKNRSRLMFGIKATWINRHEIVSAVWAAKPWQFPLRLSRLTTAATSAVAIFLMTGEAWDLGLAQSLFDLIALSLVCLMATIGFVAAKQQLFVRRRSRPSEQIVVTMVSAIGIVAAGMIVTWIVMLLGALLLAVLLFQATTIAAWAGSALPGAEAVRWTTYLAMASFSASLGILIGALGASFESQRHFRHIIFVDEEF